MSDQQITVTPAGDAERYLATDHIVWFGEVPSAPTDVQLLGVPEDQRFAADLPGSQPDTFPGIYGVFPLTLSVPGGPHPRQVPCAGLTWVGVHPDHRRQGVLTAMLRDHFERVRDTEGTRVSALHASEPAIYGRFGYGLASLELEVSLGRGTTLTAPYLDEAAKAVTTHLGSIADDDTPKRMREVHVATAGLGAVVGSLGYYERICYQLPEELRDKESWRMLYARRDGQDVGWAMFQRTHKWENGRPGGELQVWALVGDEAARLALLRRLVDFDLIASVKVRTVSSDDPLLHWAGGPRSTGDVRTYDSLWVRLVDVPGALRDRAWSAPCDVVVEVADVHAPWNEGTWRVHADDEGRADVERTTDDADLRLKVEALGSTYLGGVNLLTLQRSGLVEERRAGATAELWRALRSDVPPSAAVGF